MQDEAGVLGHRDKLVGRHGPQRRVVPADQRFGAHHTPAAQIDQGLIEEIELLVAIERPAQVSQHHQPAVGLLVHVLHEEVIAVAAALLAARQGGVGALEQDGAVIAVERVNGNADAGADDALGLPDLKRSGQRREHFPGHRLGIPAGDQVGQNDHELVTAEASEGVGLPQAGFQPPRCLLQHVIADGEAEGVVDHPEVVEVEQHHGDHAVVNPGPSDGPRQPVLSQATVGQPGQVVMGGLPQQALLQRLALGDVLLDADKPGAVHLRESGGS